MVVVFFFGCYGDHRVLHSFPTRRSSDLVLLIAGLAEKLLGPNLAINFAQLRARAIAKLRFEFTVDRKSTRLNSSHRCISYAVFCLKKKTGHKRTKCPRNTAQPASKRSLS